MSSRQKKNNPQQKNPASDEEEEVYDDGGEVNKEKDQMNKTSKSKASQKSQQQYTPDGHQPEKIISAQRSFSIIPIAIKSATAIGKSNPVPVLRMSAGERLTVIRFAGNTIPQLCKAVRTRSFASRTSEDR